MNSTPPTTKSKRSTMACTHCRERKVKCDNLNDGLSCERCKKNSKECRYEPVNPSNDSQQPVSQTDPPITGDRPIMTVYHSPSSVSPHHQQYMIDPHTLRSQNALDPQSHPAMSYPNYQYGQPPQSYPQDQYSWQHQQQQQQPQPYQQSQFSYGHQSVSPYPPTGYWPMEHRASNLSSIPRPEDNPEEVSPGS